MGAIEHIVQGWVDFVNLHHYPMGSQIVVLWDDSGEHVLDIVTCQLKPRGENKLFLQDALYALRVQRTFISFSSEISFLSWFLSISTSSTFVAVFELYF